MVQLTTEQRVFVVTHFIRTQSVREVQNAFRERLPNRNSPMQNTILKNVRKYQNTGASRNRNKGNSGRRRTGRNGHSGCKGAVTGKPAREFSSKSIAVS